MSKFRFAALPVAFGLTLCVSAGSARAQGQTYGNITPLIKVISSPVAGPVIATVVAYGTFNITNGNFFQSEANAWEKVFPPPQTLPPGAVI